MANKETLNVSYGHNTQLKTLDKVLLSCPKSFIVVFVSKPLIWCTIYNQVKQEKCPCIFGDSRNLSTLMYFQGSQFIRKSAFCSIIWPKTKGLPRSVVDSDAILFGIYSTSKLLLYSMSFVVDDAAVVLHLCFTYFIFLYILLHGKERKKRTKKRERDRQRGKK